MVALGTAKDGGAYIFYSPIRAIIPAKSGIWIITKAVIPSASGKERSMGISLHS